MAREDSPLTEQPVKVPETSGGFDETDGHQSGGRAPAEDLEELKKYLRCNHFCCSSILAKRLHDAGCNRCWCCVDCCYSCCVEKRLVDREKLHHERMDERVQLLAVTDSYNNNVHYRIILFHQFFNITLWIRSRIREFATNVASIA